MKVRTIITGGLLGAIVAIATFAVSAEAISGGNIGGRPANPDPNNPRTQSIFIMTLEGGESKSDSLLVVNNGNERQTVEMYATDGIVSNSGAYTCKQESEVQSGLGTWTTISKTSITLDAGKSQEVPFTVTMPKNADVGEHNGCIVFQAPDSDEAATGSIRVKTRQAIRIVATIPGDLHREVAISSFDVTRSDNYNPVYTLVVQNQGNVSADIDTSVRLTTLWGSDIYTNGGGYPVIANQKLELSFEQQPEDRPLFGGWYRAEASIMYDKEAGVFGTQNTANLASKEADSKIVFLTPTLGGGVIIALVLLAVGGTVWYILYRRRQLTDIRENGNTHTVAKGDTVQSIAMTYGIPWRKLVSINKIKAPYSLTAGEKLHVPNSKKPETIKNSKHKRG